MKATARVLCLVLATAVFAAACSLAQNSPASATASQANATDSIKQARKLNSEGKQDEALAIYRQVLQASPDSFEANLGAGIALDLKGDYAQARRYLAKAIEVAPQQAKPQALRSMAMSYAFESKPDEAAKFERQVLDSNLAAQNFTGAAEIANELARIYLESGDTDNAFKWYQTGYQTALRKATMAETEKNLWEFRWQHAQARIAARRGNRDEAQQHVVAAKAALDKAANPEQARFYPYLTGYVAFYTGDYKTAIADLQQADQRDPFILCLLAQAYEKTGDKAQAMEYYHKVLQSNAHNPTNAFARPLAMEKVKPKQIRLQIKPPARKVPVVPDSTLWNGT